MTAQKVTIKVSVVIDPEAWRDNFGVEAREVAEDVRSYFAEVVRDQARRIGVLAE